MTWPEEEYSRSWMLINCREGPTAGRGRRKPGRQLETIVIEPYDVGDKWCFRYGFLVGVLKV